MEKGLIQKLSMENLDVKQFIDWNEAYQQQQLTLNLQQLKSRLAAELSQSIESHVIRKQKNLQELSKAIEIILNVKQKTAQAFESGDKKFDRNENQMFLRKKSEQNLENMVQLISIKNHVDYCLEKLQPIVNSESVEENEDANENED